MSVGHYENFPVASLLLPRPLRDPVGVIYRFARAADDFADEGNDPPQQRIARLDGFRLQLEGISRGEKTKDPLFAGLGSMVREHDLPLQLFHDLLDAFTQDVVKNRYADYAEVLDYCRRSANPVGRLLLHLFKRTNETTLKQSDCVCSALQLINFWQDIDIDYSARDRVYLPQEDMRRFGVGESHLSEKRCDSAWRDLVAFQCGRARQLMLQGAPLLDALQGRLRFEIALTIQGGLRILEKLTHGNYDVFRRRPVLQWFDWPLLLLRAA